VTRHLRAYGITDFSSKEASRTSCCLWEFVYSRR